MAVCNLREALFPTYSELVRGPTLSPDYPAHVWRHKQRLPRCRPWRLCTAGWRRWWTAPWLDPALCWGWLSQLRGKEEQCNGDATNASKYVVNYSVLNHPGPLGASVYNNNTCGVTVWGFVGDLPFPSAVRGFPFFFHVSVAAGLVSSATQVPSWNQTTPLHILGISE